VYLLAVVRGGHPGDAPRHSGWLLAGGRRFEPPNTSPTTFETER